MNNIHACFTVLHCKERNITFFCKFPQLHSYQILLKLVNIWLSYSENQKGERIFETQGMCYDNFWCVYMSCRKHGDDDVLVSDATRDTGIVHHFISGRRHRLLFLWLNKNSWLWHSVQWKLHRPIRFKLQRIRVWNAHMERKWLVYDTRR